MKVFIVVVTYNGEKDIEQFLVSLRGTGEKEFAELIVVDNNSTDQTCAIVSRLAPDAHLIRNARNRGYAGAGNQGMLYAIDQGAKYIFLANQDIMFGQNWLEPLTEEMNAHSDTGSVQGLIMLDPERILINSCGNALQALGFGFTRGYRKTLDEFPCQARSEVFYCSGAAVLYRVSSLKQIGLFDEEFFMYHEDTDLGWRLRSAGYRNIVISHSRVYHHYDFNRSIQKFYFMERNRYIILLKNYELKTLALLFPLFVVWECGLLLYALVGYFLHPKKNMTIQDKFRAYAYFFSGANMMRIIKKRFEVSKTRILTDRALAPLLASEIQFQDIDNFALRHIANPMTKAYLFFIRKLI